MLELLKQPNPPSEKWFIETPINPNLLNLHSQIEFTHEMSEKYKTGGGLPSDSWLSSILALENVTQITVLRHHLRLRKTRESSWDSITPQLKEVLGIADEARWNILPEEPTEAKKRRFSTSLCQSTEAKIVIEGVYEAGPYDWSQKMFSFPGIVLAVLEPNEFMLKRGLAFTWAELHPQLDAIVPDLEQLPEEEPEEK